MCKRFVVGRDCDQCQALFYGLSLDDPDGCKVIALLNYRKKEMHVFEFEFSLATATSADHWSDSATY